MPGSYSLTDTMRVVDVLGNPRRNRVLRTLQRRETPMSVQTLAEHVDQSNEDPPGAATVALNPQTVSQLHHTHLPKLDDARVIEYDPRDQVVVSFDEERLDHLVETGLRIFESLQNERSSAD